VEALAAVAAAAVQAAVECPSISPVEISLRQLMLQAIALSFPMVSQLAVSEVKAASLLRQQRTLMVRLDAPVRRGIYMSFRESIMSTLLCRHDESHDETIGFWARTFQRMRA
jgi:hypothetical protein